MYLADFGKTVALGYKMAYSTRSSGVRDFLLDSDIFLIPLTNLLASWPRMALMNLRSSSEADSES